MKIQTWPQKVKTFTYSIIKIYTKMKGSYILILPNIRKMGKELNLTITEYKKYSLSLLIKKVQIKDIFFNCQSANN